MPDRHEPQEFSLCVRPDLSIHDGRRGDVAGHRVDLKQAAHGGRAERVADLAVLTLVQVVRKHLRELALGVRNNTTGEEILTTIQKPRTITERGLFKQD